ncbi:MAG: recombinase family protein [Gemella sp.]|nr:recombinase family protein [Gemella sp.]
MKKVRTIQTLKNIENKKIKVAAYARVSHNQLLQSLSNQVSYYNKLIQNNPDWEYAGVYVDQAISGRTTKRPEYQRLIQDAIEGKINIILTKSISRFGRDTEETLKTIRNLKEKNISVRFEKENIDTLSTDGELLITLLAALAEEESKSISENLKWKVKKKFEQGLPHNPQPLLGYRWDYETKEYKIKEDEADIVREIYKHYLEGKTIKQIIEILDKQERKTRKGNKFTKSVIHRVLGQEAYTGKLILQKTYRSPVKGRTIENKGEKAKYIVENAHVAIITKEQYDKVQEEKNKRNLHNKKGVKND